MSARKAFRCPECRTRRATWTSLTAHIQQSGHQSCGCGGYHYKHRPGSPYCECNPLAAMYQADRGGAGPEDLRKIAQYITETTPDAGAKASELLERWGLYEADKNHA